MRNLTEVSIFRVVIALYVLLFCTRGFGRNINTGSSEQLTQFLGQQACSHGFFQCKDGSCIDRYWVCDSTNDCQDGSDEINCTNSAMKCNADTDFQCSVSYQCISIKWFCDGDVDCGDATDEENCGNATCSPNYVQCATTQDCIPRPWVCDGDHDCPGGTDERNCTTNVTEPGTVGPTCSVDEFACDDGSCINKLKVCDGINDCGNDKDERECMPPTTKETTTTKTKPATAKILEECPPTLFQCASGGCRPSRWRCDGIPDCSDGSDEEECPLSVDE